MALSSGTCLGPYEVLGALGAGGMGEVYRARDTRPGRDVALKALPAAPSADADRLRRFEQEARAASALDHPNILTLHDVGSHEGAPHVVSELLEGETLRSPSREESSRCAGRSTTRSRSRAASRRRPRRTARRPGPPLSMSAHAPLFD